MKTACWLLLSLCTAVPGHKFYDPPAKAELTVAVAAAAMDTVTTCQTLALGGREHNWPTQTCAGIGSVLGGQVLVQEGVTFLVHKARWHKAERFVRLYSITVNVQGTTYTVRHR